MKTTSLDTLIDRHIGKKGTPGRDAFEQELKLELLGEAIRRERKKRNMTQEELGKLVGIKKAQISKIENSVTNAKFDTILKVFRALNLKIKFHIESFGENDLEII